MVNGMLPTGGTIPVRLIPLAWTPLGTAVGDTAQIVHVPFEGLLDWIDRTFPPDDEHAFAASTRDLELLARIGWNAPLPELVGTSNILNIEDLPEDLVAALAHPPEALVACASCRRLCVRDDFVWKEKQLCAWDFHSQVFGKRGPWHEGSYEERHFETLPSCAYVAVGLLVELGVEPVLRLGALPESVAHELVNDVLAAEASRPHMAVRTDGGFTVLREA
jgi:hypothetical protein